MEMRKKFLIAYILQFESTVLNTSLAFFSQLFRGLGLAGLTTLLKWNSKFQVYDPLRARQ